MNRKLILKSHRFVPFDANLAELEAKCAITAKGGNPDWETDGMTADALSNYHHQLFPLAVQSFRIFPVPEYKPDNKREF